MLFPLRKRADDLAVSGAAARTNVKRLMEPDAQGYFQREHDSYSGLLDQALVAELKDFTD